MVERRPFVVALIRIGFTLEAAVNIFEDQGISTVGDLEALTDKEASDLCRVVRKPGGVSAADPTKANYGHVISLKAETNMKMACYWARHNKRISRVLAPPKLTLANLDALREMKDAEDAHEDPEKAPSVEKHDWPKTLEAVQEWLCGHLGVTGVPLSYVIREKDCVKAEGDDPATGEADSLYETVEEEMIARSPHKLTGGGLAPKFLVDRKKVWELVASIFRDTPDCWTHIKPAQRGKDGRKAFKYLWDFYLGENNIDIMANSAERRLQDVDYDKERAKWNFDKYVKCHKDQHLILEGLVRYGYSGIDDRSKVRHLMDGIKTDELDSVKTQIMANPTLKADFPKCVQLYKDFIKQKQKPVDERRVASAYSHAGGAGGGGGKRKVSFNQDAKIEDRYYSAEEYRGLSEAKKAKLWQLRKSRGGGGGGGGGGKSTHKEKDKRPNDDNVAALMRTVSALTAALTADDPAEKADTVMGEAEDSSNRNHPGLTRQGKKKQ